MMKTYDDLCATMRSWLDIEPGNTSPLSLLAREMLKNARRRGHDGVLDSFIVELADYIERERASK